MIFDLEHPDLFGLLNGELSHAAATSAGDHLDVCDVCRTELAEIAVGHGLLRSSIRTLGPLVTPTIMTPILPRQRPRTAAWLVAAVVALGLVLGGLVALMLSTGSPSPSPGGQQSVVASAPLTAVSAGDTGARGELTMYGQSPGHTRMQIRTAHLPTLGPDQFYYAWLLDPGTQKMLPLGQIGPQGGSFDVAAATVDSYSAVDVSLELDDGDPSHSQTSVLRGRYSSASSP